MASSLLTRMPTQMRKHFSCERVSFLPEENAVDLAIKDLGQTLAVGVFAIFGLVSLFALSRRASKDEIFKFLNSEHKFYQTALALVVVFATGVLVEDVSKNFAAERFDDSAIFNVISTTFNYLIDTDKELRLRSLFTVHYSSAQEIELSETPIYANLMSVNDKNQHILKNKDILTAIPVSPCIRNGQRSSCKRIQGNAQIRDQANAANQLYYIAKNRVYKESTYFTELQEIEKRINFARSLTFLCLVYALLFGLLILINLLPGRWALMPTTRTKRKLIGLVFCFYLVGMFLGRLSFRSETINYNLRVFGYYISLISDEAISPKSVQPSSQVIPSNQK